MKKVAMIIASEDFRDEEYFITKEILEDNNVKVKTISNKRRAIGRFGGEAEADILIDDLDVNDFDAIVFVGGLGAVKFIDNELSYDLIKETVEKDKVLAAICIAPTILAKAGVLTGKRCTVWSSNMDKSAINTVKENQGLYQEEAVVIDSKIITAENHEAAEEFGKAIVKVLTMDDI